MARPWVILSLRYGGDIDDPTSDDLARAIRELYVEDLPGMTEGDYEEHGAAFLRHGFDDGPMSVLYDRRGGIVTFEEWADRDFNVPLAPARVMTSVTPQVALGLWMCLAGGRIEQVRDHAWPSHHASSDRGTDGAG